jgi:hypothetical protein
MRPAPRRALQAFLAFAASSGAAGVANATPSARLVYARSTTAKDCPDEPALHKAVAARFGYDPFFAWAKQTVIVQIFRDDRRFTARVQLVDENGLALGTREIASDEGDCTELFGAAALAISIALDASAQTPSPPPLDPAAPPPPALTPALAAPLAAPADVTPDVASRDASPRAAAPAGRSSVRLGLDARASVGIAPDPVPGLAAFADLRSGPVTWGLELGVDASLASTRLALPASSPAQGNVRSVLVAGAFVPCGHLGPTFACVVAEMGWLEARASSNLAHPSSDGMVFAAAGGRIGAEWPLSALLFLRIRGDLVAELNRPTYELDGQSPFTANAVAGTFGLGMGAQLP